MFHLSFLLFHINRNAKINKQTTKPAATTATTIRAVLSPSPLGAACSPGRPVAFSVVFPSTVTRPKPVVASVLLVVFTLVFVVVVGGLAVPRDVPRFVVVVVASVVEAAVVVTRPTPVVASVLLVVFSLVVVVVVGGLAVPRDVPRFVVVVVASVVVAAVVVGAVVVPAVVGGAVVVVMVEAAVVAVVVVVRCVVIDRFMLVVEGGWVTFEERNDNCN